MRETKLTRVHLRRKSLTNSISAKLIGSLFAAMIVIFALLGYLNIRLHRQHLEAATLVSAERVSDPQPRTFLGTDYITVVSLPTEDNDPDWQPCVPGTELLMVPLPRARSG